MDHFEFSSKKIPISFPRILPVLNIFFSFKKQFVLNIL